jgi:N-acetyl-D-muramate 6-phosphate phosphatase
VQEIALNRPVARHRLVLFDLDGTLVDTAEDLANAVNRCRTGRGLKPLPSNELRPWTSHGARGLIRHAFGIEPSDAGYDELRAEFLDHYGHALCVHSRLYEGMERTLAAIEASDRIWGVVTNKPARFTDPLMTALGLARRASCIVSGDTAARPKPDPAPIRHALQVCSVDPGDCVYVGDDLRDVQAGQAAGVRTIVAAYGYLAGATDVAGWGADFVIHRPLDLLGWLRLESS